MTIYIINAIIEPKRKGEVLLVDDTLCIARLENMKKNAKKAESRLLDTVLSNLDGMEAYTISSLAKEAQVSYATVCRMLEKIGVSGFKEFKSLICEGSAEGKKDEALSESKISNFKIAKAVFGEALRQIESCRSELSEDVLDKAVATLSDAGTVMFTGLGSSAVAAQYAYTEFFGILTHCFYSNDMIMAKMKASILNQGDVLFAVSSSGKTKPVIEAAKVARSSGAAVVALTDCDASPLADVSDIVISTGAKSKESGADTEAHYMQGQITAINVIYSCVNARLGSDKNKRKQGIR